MAESIPQHHGTTTWRLRKVLAWAEPQPETQFPCALHRGRGRRKLAGYDIDVQLPPAHRKDWHRTCERSRKLTHVR